MYDFDIVKDSTRLRATVRVQRARMWRVAVLGGLGIGAIAGTFAHWLGVGAAAYLLALMVFLGTGWVLISRPQRQVVELADKHVCGALSAGRQLLPSNEWSFECGDISAVESVELNRADGRVFLVLGDEGARKAIVTLPLNPERRRELADEIARHLGVTCRHLSREEFIGSARRPEIS